MAACESLIVRSGSCRSLADSTPPGWRFGQSRDVVRHRYSARRDHLLPAVGRLRVSSIREEHAFRAFNRNRPYSQRVRPFNFLNVFHLHRLRRTGGRHRKSLVAPYERSPSKWLSAPVLDRHDPGGGALRIRTHDPYAVVEGEEPVATLGAYFEDYLNHPEVKLAHEGRYCFPWTKGVLESRCILATSVTRIGKESSRLADPSELLNSGDERIVLYGEPRRCQAPDCGRLLTGRQRTWCSEACRKRAFRAHLREKTTNRASPDQLSAKEERVGLDV
jgi:hypothetical protein